MAIPRLTEVFRRIRRVLSLDEATLDLDRFDLPDWEYYKSRQARSHAPASPLNRTSKPDWPPKSFAGIESSAASVSLVPVGTHGYDVRFSVDGHDLGGIVSGKPWSAIVDELRKREIGTVKVNNGGIEGHWLETGSYSLDEFESLVEKNAW